MDREYDLFEKLADGASMWRGVVSGHDNAIGELRMLAATTANEVFLMHVPTKTVIATINGSV